MYIYRVVGPSAVKVSLESQLVASGVPFRFISESNTLGLYSAINEAVVSAGKSCWTHFTYINDDDCLGSGFAQALEFHLRRAPESLGYGNVSLIDQGGARLGRIPTESDPRYFEALLSLGISPFNQQGMIVPRSLWEKLGGFRTEFQLAADLDFWLRAHRLSWPFRYYGREMGQFRINPGQLSGDTQRLAEEIRTVYERDRPRTVGVGEARFAKWRFRLANWPAYAGRLRSGKAIRGMDILNGGGRT